MGLNRFPTPRLLPGPGPDSYPHPTPTRTRLLPEPGPDSYLDRDRTPTSSPLKQTIFDVISKEEFTVGEKKRIINNWNLTTF